MDKQTATVYFHVCCPKLNLVVLRLISTCLNPDEDRDSGGMKGKQRGEGISSSSLQ